MKLIEIAKAMMPNHWEAEEDMRGVLLHAPSFGYVTISEEVRNYALGITRVREHGLWSGRKWKERLTAEAIKALMHSEFQQKRQIELHDPTHETPSGEDCLTSSRR